MKTCLPASNTASIVLSPKGRPVFAAEETNSAGDANVVAESTDSHISSLLPEIRAQTEFRHQNIVQFLGMTKGAPPSSPSNIQWMLVTELCDTDLNKLMINPHNKLPWHIKVKLAEGIANGMEYLHEREMCHLDLKPSNILIKGREPKLSDFGSLRQLKLASGVRRGVGGPSAAQQATLDRILAAPSDEAASQSLSQQDAALDSEEVNTVVRSIRSSSFTADDPDSDEILHGTPEWLAPEQRASKAADVYSFGIIMWELSTRQRPYTGFGRREVVERMGPSIVPIWTSQGQRPRWISECTSPEWQALAEQCWAHD
eukprot:SAG31_NODE_3952_length_3722_cov_5.626553_3_plen_314_part_01